MDAHYGKSNGMHHHAVLEGYQRFGGTCCPLFQGSRSILPLKILDWVSNMRTGCGYCNFIIPLKIENIVK
jgi:hypothetical protein